MLCLTSTAVKDLSALHKLPQLHALYLDDTEVTDEEVKALREAIPDCIIMLPDETVVQ
jgi:hypothetical protein